MLVAVPVEHLSTSDGLLTKAIGCRASVVVIGCAPAFRYAYVGRSLPTQKARNPKSRVVWEEESSELKYSPLYVLLDGFGQELRGRQTNTRTSLGCKTLHLRD